MTKAVTNLKQEMRSAYLMLYRTLISHWQPQTAANAVYLQAVGVIYATGSSQDGLLIAYHGKHIMHARMQAFDVVIDATGSSQGILLALAMVRCMGTIVLKSTCSLKDPEQPQWSAIANDLVVNEKRLVGSRYGCMLLLLLVKTG